MALWARPTGVCRKMEECPEAAKRHTRGPSDFTAWMKWAAGMRKTHEQTMCPVCGYIACWERKYPDPKPI